MNDIVKQNLYNEEWIQSELDRIGFIEDTDFAKATKYFIKTIVDLSHNRKEIRKDMILILDKLHANLPLTPITEDDETYEDEAGCKRVVRCNRIFQDPNNDNKWFDEYAITFKGDDGNLFWTEKSVREVKLPYEVGTKIIRM